MDLELPDGRTLRVHDSGSEGLPVFWLHGTPGTGDLLPPLLAVPGVRLVSYDRPGYGGSTRLPGRNPASAAADVTAAADALGLDRFAVVGYSGGGPLALACGALLPDRVTAVVAVSSPAPLSADDLDWFGGMVSSGEAGLRAAMAGREALEAYLASVEYNPEVFTEADHAALAGPWASVGANSVAAMPAGFGGVVDDDLSFVAPWGFDPAQVSVPTLFLHGVPDRMVPSKHAEWLANRCGPHSELRLSPEDGHVSILNGIEAAFDWLLANAARH